MRTPEPIADVGALQIAVEKMLCNIVGRTWAPTGFSIETLCADISKELDAVHDAAVNDRRAVHSYRAGNTALLEALMDMVWQFIGVDDRDAPFSHSHMAAEEGAVAVLIDAGMAEEVGPGRYRLLWDKLEARKPKQQTWSEAVRECVSDPAEQARLLAMKDEMPGSAE